jgi:hypothetical protein
MFGRIARKVLDVFAAIENVAPTNRVRLACEGLEDRCTPATFTVDTSADFPDWDTSDGKAGQPGDMPGAWETSLRSAVQQGNHDAAHGAGSSHVIAFDLDKLGKNNPISLGIPLDPLNAHFQIVGDGEQSIVIERAEGVSAKFPVFKVLATRIADFINLQIRGGVSTTSGGSIISLGGHVYVSNCLIYNNTADQWGGGIWADGGKLNITDSSIHWNQAKGGGGIATSGATTEFKVTTSDVFANAATGDGGGIYTTASGTVFTGLRVFGNEAGLTGGGIYARKEFRMDGGQLHANTAGGNGGGLYLDSNNTAVTHLASVRVTNNQSGWKGGGMYVKTGILSFSNSPSFSGNKASNAFDGAAYLPPADIHSNGLPGDAQEIRADA